jgi:hypothetical protein
MDDDRYYSMVTDEDQYRAYAARIRELQLALVDVTIEIEELGEVTDSSSDQLKNAIVMLMTRAMDIRERIDRLWQVFSVMSTPSVDPPEG